jgi:Protein of unknown function (DUF3105)
VPVTALVASPPVAKKTRTPPPPRPVQVPKHRPGGGARPGLDLTRQTKLAVGGGLLALVVIVAVVLALVVPGSSSGSDAAVAKAMAAAGCTFVTKPVLPPKHKVPSGYHLDVPKLTSKVKWSTFPPSGGSHYAAWAVWGFYTDPVNPRQVVHNEEHGGVIIWWGPKVPQSTVDQLHDFYSEKPEGMFGTPIAGLGNKIALTAWTGDPRRYYQNGYYGIGHLATCTQFNEKAFKKFRDAYRGKGPEGIPLSADAPGMGPSS